MKTDDYAIRVSNLNKIFKLYTSPKQMVKEVFGLGIHHREFLALCNITFKVRKGETVGIMGRNGAGKSTLLRILAGTLDATSGIAEINGRVSAILELGSGFNTEYTGRENILSGGLVMGMTKKEIRDRIDDIIAFSELEEFIDRPFKTYSSGMQARLTFATAISVNPEILIVDEALSVGDAAFQAKCYARIQQFRAEGGTIFLVSHSDNAITQFCDRALLLDHGKLIMDAPPREVTMAYCDMLWGRKNLTADNVASLAPSDAGPCVTKMTDNAEQVLKSEVPLEYQTGAHFTEADIPLALLMKNRDLFRQVTMRTLNLAPFQPSRVARRMGERKEAEIIDFGIFDLHGVRVRRLETGRKYACTMKALFYDDVESYIFGFVVRTTAGVVLFSALSSAQPYNTGIIQAKCGQCVDLTMEFTCWLANGTFFLTGNIGNLTLGSEHIIDGFFDGIEFSLLQHAELTTDSCLSLQPVFCPPVPINF